MSAIPLKADSLGVAGPQGLAAVAVNNIAAIVNCAKFESTSFSSLPELIKSIPTVYVGRVRETVACVRRSGAVTMRRLSKIVNSLSWRWVGGVILTLTPAGMRDLICLSTVARVAL